MRINGICKKHLQLCAKSLIYISVLFIIVALIALGVMNAIIAPDYEKVANTVEKIGYGGVVETSTKDDGIMPLYKLNNLVTIKSESNKQININLYSMVDGLDVQANTGYQFFDINDNEIVISKKVAQKINASVGSVIYIEYSFREEPTAYTVSEITEYLTDYYNFERNCDFSIAIVGSGNVLEEKAVGKYVSLVSDDELNSFFIGERSYSSVYKVQDEIDLLRHTCFIKYVAIGLMYLAFIVVLSILISKNVGIEINKYYRVGYPITDVLKIRNVDYLLFIGIPQAVILVTLVPGLITGHFDIVLFATMLMMSIISLCIILLGEGKYATAYKF